LHSAKDRSWPPPEYVCSKSIKKTAEQPAPGGPQPRAIAFDSRRERFLLMEGAWLWIYTPAKGRSSILTRFDNLQCAGVAWSAELDCIYTIQCGLVYGGAKPYQLRSYDAEESSSSKSRSRATSFLALFPKVQNRRRN
jgi:hypothetical protein